MGLVAAGLGWLVRSLLAPVLYDQLPYTLFVVSVLIASVFGGWRAGVTGAVFSALFAHLSFVSPAGQFTFQGSRGWSFGVFIFVSLILVGLVNALRSSLRRETRLSDEMMTISEEYRHRIKNLLTVALALVDQTGRNSASIAEFKDTVLDRLHALSRAQDLLSMGEAQAAPLSDVLAQALSPFDLDHRLARAMTGPAVFVSADVAIALALLLNELATNATKYGALSVPDGRLTIAWRGEGDLIVIEWKEIDGPPVTPPENLGFGSRLFDAALSRGHGSAELAFEPSGVRCQIRVRASSAGTSP